MNNDFQFPSKQDVINEWNWGWFGNDASQINFYVQNKLFTPEEFQQLTGQPYNAN